MKRIIKKFTLTELIIALAVFLILIAVIMQIFKTTQTSWSASDSERNIFENARVALDVIGRDLQCIYYGEENAPFWHHAAVDNWGSYNNELLAFVTTTPFPESPYSSDLFEVKYQLYYTTKASEDTAGWILRSSTGNLETATTANPKWNFSSNFVCGYKTDAANPSSAFTADTSSNGEYVKLVPHVTDLAFSCYDVNGNEVDSDFTSSMSNDGCVATGFPYSIEVKVKLLDKISWNKWIKMFNNGDFPGNESYSAQAFRLKHEREFKQMILIGDRGQM